MGKYLLVGFNRHEFEVSGSDRPDVRAPALVEPFPVTCLVLRTSAADTTPDNHHWNQQPKEGECNRDQAKRVHEPRFAKIAQVLIDEPEHPSEEHECYQFSQCVSHGL